MAEKMKPSGIDWIGDIPNNWETSRIKYHYQISLGKMLQPIQENSTDTLEHYMCSANITWAGVDTSILKQMWFSPAEKKQYRLLDGDLLVSEGGDVAVSCIWRNELDECYLQNAVHRVRQNALSDNRFIYYWLFFLKNYGIVDLICNKATIAHFTKEKFGELPICIMSIDEQVAIADFLDKECAQIDSIAADLEKQIELLQQYKKSLITEAVTKGLDKSVPMKDSGVEWLGKIPAHWNFKRLKFMLENSSDSMKVGPFGSALSGSDFTDEGKWVYNQRVVLDNNFSENTTFVSEEKFQEMRSFAVCPGDILITTRGTIGKVAIVPEGANEGILHPCIIKFRVDKEMIIPELLQLIFNESDFVKDQFTLMSNATTIEVIYSYSLKDIPLPVIPADEQKKIYGYLSKKCLAIDGIIAEKQKSLATITQHKKSLIYEYVTGKKRVKEVR